MNVRRAISILALIFAATAVTLGAQQQAAPPPAQQTVPPATPAPTPTQAPALPQRLVILDPAHGGTDPGARGANGSVEKDVVLYYARAAKLELERQGFRVILTREGDQNPSFDDRAAVANAHRNAIFISLHVSSTGPSGTARVYSYEFSQAPEIAQPVSAFTASQQPPSPPPAPMPAGVIPWETAQKPFLGQSLRFAEILQSELAQKFSGSPQSSTPAAERSLRSVAAPAVAVEICSVTAADEKTLESFAPSVAAAIARAASTFRPAPDSGQSSSGSN